MVTKKAYTLILVLMLASTYVLAQKDLVILRNGMDYLGQVVMVSNDKTVFKNANGLEQDISNRDLYMIKYDKRGNVFFTETGERFTDDENEGKMPKGSAAIYLIEGKEVIGYDISIDVDKITYYPPKKKNFFNNPFFALSKKSNEAVTIPKETVFMVMYQDGTKDLINDFETLKKKRAEELAQKKAQEEEAKREAWLRSFPKSATIITKKEIVINAIVLSDDGIVVTFKKTSMTNSPVFMMDRENIQDVFYKD